MWTSTPSSCKWGHEKRPPRNKIHTLVHPWVLGTIPPHLLRPQDKIHIPHARSCHPWIHISPRGASQSNKNPRPQKTPGKQKHIRLSIDHFAKTEPETSTSTRDLSSDRARRKKSTIYRPDPRAELPRRLVSAVRKRDERAGDQMVDLPTTKCAIATKTRTRSAS